MLHLETLNLCSETLMMPRRSSSQPVIPQIHIFSLKEGANFGGLKRPLEESNEKRG